MYLYRNQEFRMFTEWAYPTCFLMLKKTNGKIESLFSFLLIKRFTSKFLLDFFYSKLCYRYKKIYIMLRLIYFSVIHSEPKIKYKIFRIQIMKCIETYFQKSVWIIPISSVIMFYTNNLTENCLLSLLFIPWCIY